MDNGLATISEIRTPDPAFQKISARGKDPIGLRDFMEPKGFADGRG